MLRINYTDRYNNSLKQITTSEEFLDLVEKKVLIFQKNPKDSRLKNHPLRKRLKGKWAFSITLDIRIIYEQIGENTVRFLAIGPHTKVYDK